MRKPDRGEPGLKQLIDKLPDGIVIAEIGCYQGESTEIFLSSGKIKHLYAIDPWKNGYDDNDIASYKVDMKLVEDAFDKRLSNYSNFTKLKFNSNDAIKFIPDQLDAIYIDGLHTYDGVKNDILNYLPLLKDTGYICGHDYRIELPEVMQAVNDILGVPEFISIDYSWMFQKLNLK